MTSSLKLFTIILLLTNISYEMKSQIRKDFFPEAPPTWIKDGPVRNFDQETLYNYIDGGAELFISYDFISAASQKYFSETRPVIMVDIFDMGRPENAYGVFCHVREETSTRFGQGAQVYDDAIVFWKGRYYVSVMAYDLTPEVRKVLPIMAGEISDKITATGDVPGIVKILPGDGLDKNSILYFHHYIWQNNLGYLADTNFLNIDNKSDGVLANYHISGDKLSLLLIDYHDSAKAGEAFESCRTYFDMGEGNPEYITLPDKRQMSCFYKGNYLILVFQGKEKQNTESLIRYFQKLLL